MCYGQCAICQEDIHRIHTDSYVLPGILIEGKKQQRGWILLTGEGALLKSAQKHKIKPPYIVVQAADKG
ncbi:MAG: hypothetical protein PHO15_06895 [Eubacteriales bacterium]|nr:hypothetical protein [Eubacteriales bacterium]